MTIEIAVLRWCSPDNLIRLARALRVTLPAQNIDPWLWQRKAARVLAVALERDRRAA
jgi:hypothetical protein